MQIVTILALFCPAGNTALGQVKPPQGYIGFRLNFPNPDPVYWNGTQKGFYNFDYEILLKNSSDALAGTFWAFNFSFRDSTKTLPANHVGGEQGGYVGLQVKGSNDSLAIFSIWWALDARPGPGANCVEDIEAWYNDANPWAPAITSMDQTDSSRKVAGGPFRSCRLPITLSANTKYRIRLWEISNARKPNEPEWWGAWLIDVTNGKEYLIGQIQTPGEWSWLNGGTGGFIEHFGLMPNGCASIPASQNTIFPTRADNGSQLSTTEAYLYGNCETDLKSRTSIDCDSGQCDITIK